MLKFPYAFNEFERLINGGYVYIDRTDKIRLMEEWGDERIRGGKVRVGRDGLRYVKGG